ncbi:MAG: transporter substrate-binding domain-containing protein [Caldilineaceae bacterium]
MFAGLFIIANFTASVTTRLTVQQIQGAINGPQDLPGKVIVTVEGSTAATWLTEQGIPHRTVATVNAAYPLLEDEQVQAVVYDYPVLRYHALNFGEGRIEVVARPSTGKITGLRSPQAARCAKKSTARSCICVKTAPTIRSTPNGSAASKRAGRCSPLRTFIPPSACISTSAQTTRVTSSVRTPSRTQTRPRLGTRRAAAHEGVRTERLSVDESGPSSSGDCCPFSRRRVELRDETGRIPLRITR